MLEHLRYGINVTLEITLIINLKLTLKEASSDGVEWLWFGGLRARADKM